ncbi:MAG TPA: hypothetical protein VK453_18365 [Micromonosporaceae bacterium]|nr:hypothetical protein [Micromonosporaceae bacterium]
MSGVAADPGVPAGDGLADSSPAAEVRRGSEVRSDAAPWMTAAINSIEPTMKKVASTATILAWRLRIVIDRDGTVSAGAGECLPTGPTFVHRSGKRNPLTSTVVSPRGDRGDLSAFPPTHRLKT